MRDTTKIIVDFNIVNNDIVTMLCICNELGDLWVGWDPNRPTAIRFSKEHRHNPVMV